MPKNTLAIISYFATSLYDKVDEDEIFWDITKNCIHHLGLEDCVIYTLDEEKNVLIQVAAYGNKNPNDRELHNRIEISIGDGVVGCVFQNREPEIIANTSKESRYIVDDLKRGSELAVPIIVGNKAYGVIDSEHSQVNFFTQEHLHIFNILASLCAQKLERLSKKRKKLTASNELYSQLLVLLNDEHIYSRPDLSLESLAERLAISPTYLSYLINDVTGNGFNQLINGYRVRRVKKLIKEKMHNRFSIVSLGLEAGFNSKSSFYSWFKRLEGVSPSIYAANSK